MQPVRIAFAALAVAMLTPVALAQTPPAGKGAEAAIARMFTIFDKNGDGALQASEVAGSNLEKEFAGMDANKDGKVTKEEFTKYRADKMKQGVEHPHG